MTKNKKLLLGFSSVALVAGVSIPLAIVLTSCSSKSANPVLDLYSNFEKSKDKLSTNQYGLLSKTNREEYVKNLSNYIDQFQSLLKEFNNKKLDLNINQQVWLKTILFDLTQEKKNFDLNMRYLGGTESNNENVYPCDAFNNYVTNNAQDAITVTDSNNKITNQSVNAGIKKLNDFIDYLNNLEQNFKDGASANVAQSIIIQRLFIANMVQTFYANELNYWAQPDSIPVDNSGCEAITFNELINGPTKVNKEKQAKEAKTSFTKTDYMLQSTKEVDSSNVSQATKQEYSKLASKAQTTLNSFIEYFINDYFANAIKENSSYGFGGTNRPFLYKVETSVPDHSRVTNDKEVERTYTDISGKNKLYGMGLTQQDLDTKNVGLSYMKSSEGSAIYNHLLELSTTTELTPQQVYDKGIKNTDTGVKNMKALANAVVSLQTDNNPNYIKSNQGINLIQKQQKGTTQTWDPVIAFDPDGVGPQKPEVQQLDFKYVDPNKLSDSSNQQQWNTNWTNFNRWLNDENFFWGRELTPSSIKTVSTSSANSQPTTTTSLGSSMFTESDYKVLLSDSTPTQQQLDKYGISVKDWQKYKQDLIKTGYWKQWNVDKKMIGNIPTKSALCGAITELRDYWKFVHNYAEGYLNGRFTKKVADFNIMPYNYVDKDVAGVGASGGPGDNTFYLNVDPYSDLQKWSETSFTGHETFLGHRTQGEYVTEYPAKVNGKTGPIFSFTAYAEGWAVFMEWFNNQISAYGTVNPNGGIPLDFHGDKSNGFVAGDLHSTNFKNKGEIEEFQNGVYWDAINRNNNFTLKKDNDGWSIATELGNMLQYYGFLNEAQLRNMRQAVDTALHAKFSTNNSSTLNAGASIQDVRNYLHQNSALGIGDVSNESLRYLAYPGQATSYMTGKDVMQNIYETVNKQYQKENKTTKQIFEDTKAIQKLFDVYLRNGDVPLSVLQQEVYQTYNIKNSN